MPDLFHQEGIIPVDQVVEAGTAVLFSQRCSHGTGPGAGRKALGTRPDHEGVRVVPPVGRLGRLVRPGRRTIQQAVPVDRWRRRRPLPVARPTRGAPQITVYDVTHPFDGLDEPLRHQFPVGPIDGVAGQTQLVGERPGRREHLAPTQLPRLNGDDEGISKPAIARPPVHAADGVAEMGRPCGPLPVSHWWSVTRMIRRAPLAIDAPRAFRPPDVPLRVRLRRRALRGTPPSAHATPPFRSQTTGTTATRIAFSLYPSPAGEYIAAT